MYVSFKRDNHNSQEWTTINTRHFGLIFHPCIWDSFPEGGSLKGFTKNLDSFQLFTNMMVQTTSVEQVQPTPWPFSHLVRKILKIPLVNHAISHPRTEVQLTKSSHKAHSCFPSDVCCRCITGYPALKSQAASATFTGHPGLDCRRYHLQHSLLDGALQHHGALINAILLDDLAVMEHVELLSCVLACKQGRLIYSTPHLAHEKRGKIKKGHKYPLQNHGTNLGRAQANKFKR